MTKTSITAALLIILAVPLSQARAACEIADLAGRWSAYSIGSPPDLTFMQSCLFHINRSGEFRSGSRCSGFGLGTAPLNNHGSTVETDGFQISKNCVIAGVIEHTFDEGTASCRVDATLASDKQIVNGFVRCTSPLFSVVTGSLFNMVRRPTRAGG
jgi:hypothetical protein